MISVIIASADSTLLQQVTSSVDDTIGVPYEIISVDNYKGVRGICTIYNEGIAKAKGETLCFMHEDIEFKTFDWGKAVQHIFLQHPEVGVLGVAGTTFKSIMPIGWANQGSPHTERSRLIQSHRYTGRETFQAYLNPNNEKLSEVVVVDGMWMCVRGEVAAKYLFDGGTFKGFHCYDIDYCLSVGQEYKIAVTYDVLLEHFSEGNCDRRWMDQSLLLYHKWERSLPKSTTELSKKQVSKIEKQNFRYWLKQIHALGFKEGAAYQLLHRPRLLTVLRLKYFLKLHYSIFALYHLKKKRSKA